MPKRKKSSKLLDSASDMAESRKILDMLLLNVPRLKKSVRESVARKPAKRQPVPLKSEC